MPTYLYYPPGPEEQKSFAALFFGSVAAELVVALGCYNAPDPHLRPVLVGAGLAVVVQLGRAAWQMEQKGQRAKNGRIEVGAELLRVTGLDGRTQEVAYPAITHVDVTGGRLHLQWPGGELKVGARELQNGMNLTQDVLTRLPKKEKPGNFIPLEPR